jgi:hypothetical protein
MRQYKYVALVRELHYILILVFGFGVALLINTPLTNQIVFNNLLCIDPLVLNVKVILLVTVISCLLISFNYINKQLITVTNNITLTFKTSGSIHNKLLKTI